jgi:hypothetical protein
MSALVLALALAFAQPAAEEGQPPPAPPADAAAPAAAETSAAQGAPWPAGAPRDDYLLVGWCYGALRGYLDLHDEVMPEVTRIESEFRRPGSKLSDDLKVYADEQAQAQKDLKRFQAALTAAEKASIRPINIAGAAAVAKGHAIWTAPPGTPKARLAQEWMSWTLPARCETTATELQKKALLMGPAFKVNTEEAEQPPASAEAEPATDKPAEAAPPRDAPAETPPQ